MSKILNFPWEAVNNRVAKVGVGAYLTAPEVTAVTTAYTRVLGTFENVELEGFFIDTANDNKLTYHPDDGIARTFILIYSTQVSAPSVNDVITVGVEAGDGSPVILTGSESVILCRVADTRYGETTVLPVELEDGDTIELQIKGNSSFNATVYTFNAVLIKAF